jgi:hypothetical protein
MLITGLKRVTWNTRLGMLFSSDSKSSADGGGNCSRVGSKNKQSKLYHKNGHNISTNIYKLMTYFTQNFCSFTTKSVNTTSTFVPLPLQCFQNVSFKCAENDKRFVDYIRITNLTVSIS